MTNHPEQTNSLRERVDEAISWFTGSDEPAVSDPVGDSPVADAVSAATDDAAPAAVVTQAPDAPVAAPDAPTAAAVAEPTVRPAATVLWPGEAPATPAFPSAPAAQAPSDSVPEAASDVDPEAALEAPVDAAAPEPSVDAATPEPSVDAATPEPSVDAATPEPSVDAAALEPSAAEPQSISTPEGVDGVTTPEAVATPEPVTTSEPITPEPTTKPEAADQPASDVPVAKDEPVATDEPEAEAATSGSLFRDETPTVALAGAAVAGVAAATPAAEKTAVIDPQETARLRRQERAARDRQLGKVIASQDDDEVPVAPVTPPSTYKGLPSFGLFLFRLIIAAVVGVRAYQHITHLTATRQMWEATILQSPATIAWVQIGIESAVVVMLVFGLGTRIAGLLLFVGSLAQLLFVQWGAVNPLQPNMTDFIGVVDVLLAAAGLLLATVGGGRAAIDGAIHVGRVKRKNGKLFA